MKVHSLSIDSSQRDTNVYVYANSYVVTLENPIYDVTEFKLVSARIPTPQLATCATNKTFSIDGVDITLDETNYSNGHVLATDLDLKLEPSSNVDTVTFDADTNSLVFSNTGTGDHTFAFEFFDGTNGYTETSSRLTTPHQLLGFASDNYTSVNKQIRSGAINLRGPNSLVLRVTSGSDEFTQTVYTSTPFYTGHILLDGSDVINIHGADDPLVHRFHSGPQKIIKELKIEFFYMSHGRLIPYDFRNQEHILKFEVTCSTDKLEGLTKVTPQESKVTEKIKNPGPDILYNQDVYIYIGIILFIGTVLMLLMKRRPD